MATEKRIDLKMSKDSVLRKLKLLEAVSESAYNGKDRDGFLVDLKEVIEIMNRVYPVLEIYIDQER